VLSFTSQVGYVAVLAGNGCGGGHMRRMFLRSEKGGGDHGDAVRTAVGVFAGGDHDSVEKNRAEPVSQPDEVPDVMVVHDR